MSQVHIITESLRDEQNRRERFRTCFGPEDDYIKPEEMVAMLNSAADGKDEIRSYVVKGL